MCSIQEPAYNGQRTNHTGRTTQFQSVVIDNWYSILNSTKELETYITRTSQYGNDAAIVNSFYGYLDGPTGATVNVSVKAASNGSVFDSSQEIRIESIGFTSGRDSGTPKYYFSNAMGGKGYPSDNAYDRTAQSWTFTIDNNHRWLTINLTNICNWNSNFGRLSHTVRWADLRVEVQ